MSNGRAAWALWAATFMLTSACGGSARDNQPTAPGDKVFPDASVDCSGCRYVYRGLVVPAAIYVDDEAAYVEDHGAGTLLRVPLSGAAPKVLSDGLVSTIFAIQDNLIFFAADDPVTVNSRGLWSVPRDGSSSPTLLTHYTPANELELGRYQGHGILKGTTASGAAVIYQVEDDGTKTVLRNWPTVEASPISGSSLLLPSGELLWADFSPGFLSAPDPAATEMRIATGWAAQGIMNSPSGVMVSNQRHADPSDTHRIFLRGADGELSQIAQVTGDDVGAPWFLAGAAVVAVSRTTGALVLTPNTGAPTVLVNTVSLTPKGLTASNDYIYFTGHIGGNPWSLYRIPIAL